MRQGEGRSGRGEEYKVYIRKGKGIYICIEGKSIYRKGKGGKSI